MAQLRPVTGAYTRSPPSPAAEFVKRWDPEIRRVTRNWARRFGRTADADDFAQEARLRLFLLSPKHRDSPDWYIRAVISNAVTAAGNRQRRDYGNAPLTEEVEQSLIAETHEVDHKQHEIVRVWLRDLSPRLHTIYELIYSKGMTQGAAGVLLGVSQPRIAQLHRQLLTSGRAYFSSIPAVA